MNKMMLLLCVFIGYIKIFSYDILILVSQAWLHKDKEIQYMSLSFNIDGKSISTVSSSNV